MKIRTRSAKASDRDRFIWIEKGATPGLSYVNDVWEMFTRGDDGEFSAALYGDELGGMGKLTRLYADYAWLETLRVHPDYQGKGLGKAIYDRYLEQMAQMRLSAIGMYTNYDNKASRSLAERYGLQVKARFNEFTKLDVPKTDVDFGDMRLVCEADSREVLEKHFDKSEEFLVLNRTFYPVKAGLAEMLAANGWMYAGSLGMIVMGYRFQLEKALHVAFMQGDKDELLKFAYAKAAEIGAGSVSAMRMCHNSEEHEFLSRNGFVKNSTDYITLWRDDGEGISLCQRV